MLEVPGGEACFVVTGLEREGEEGGGKRCGYTAFGGPEVEEDPCFVVTGLEREEEEGEEGGGGGGKRCGYTAFGGPEVEEDP